MIPGGSTKKYRQIDKTEYNCNFGCWDLFLSLLKEKGTHESFTIN